MSHPAHASSREQRGERTLPRWSARLRTEPAVLAAVFIFGACSGSIILLLVRGRDIPLRSSIGSLATALPLLAIVATLALDWRRGALTAAAAWRGTIAAALVLVAWPAAAWGIPSRIPLWQLVGLFTPPLAIAVTAGFAWGGVPPTAGRCVRRAAAAYVGLCLPLLTYALVVPSPPGRIPATTPSLATLLPYLVFGGILIGLTVVPVGGLMGGYLRAGRLPAQAHG